MDTSRTARRNKSLEVAPIDGDRLAFRLALEDTSHSPDGEELIHSLEITGELALQTLEITRIEPRAIHQPYAECGASLAPIRDLVGARIGGGFRARVLEATGRVRGCTHFMTLALDLGAAHTLSVFLRMREKAAYASRNDAHSSWLRAGLDVEPRLENACIALQSSSRVIETAKRNKADDVLG